MKKRVSLLILTCCLLLPGIKIQAAEKQILGLGKYFELFVNEIAGNNSEEGISSLMDSGEELIKNVKPEDAQKLLDFIRKQIQDGKLDSDTGIEKAIEEGEKEFQVTLTKEQKEKIKSVISKIKKLGIAPEFVLDQVEKIYTKYAKELAEDSVNSLKENSKDVLNETQNKIKEEISKSLTDYLSDMVQSVKSFFKGIFNR